VGQIRRSTERNSINQSINLFVMKHSTRDISVTALTGTTRLKSANGSPKHKHEFKQNLHIKIKKYQ